MNLTKNQKIAFLATAAAGVLILDRVRRLHNDLYDRFPDVSRKDIRKAYWTLMRKVMTDQIDSDIESADDDEMDKIFLKELHRIQNSK